MGLWQRESETLWQRIGRRPQVKSSKMYYKVFSGIIERWCFYGKCVY
jgi:hypothetical protein